MNAVEIAEVRRQVTARVANWNDEHVAVRGAQARPLHVTASSQYPSTSYK